MLFSEILGHHTSRDVEVFKQDLRSMMHNVFMSIWNSKEVST